MDSQKKEINEITRQSMLRFESVNFEPALRAIQKINEMNMAPVIQAMQTINQINMRPMIDAVQTINKINARPMISALEHSRAINVNVEPIVNAVQTANQINMAPMIKAMRKVNEINMAPMIQAMQTMNEINTRPMLQAIQIMSERNREIVQQIVDSFSVQITSLLKNIDFSYIYRPYENIFKLAKEFKIGEKLIIRFLNEHQWFVLPSMPKDFIHDIFDVLTEDNKRKKLNDHFFKYFAYNDFENLIDLVDGWNSSGKLRFGRLKVINDCLNAIVNSKNGKIPSTMVVPTLIAQIDGIQREFLLKNNFEPVWIKYQYEGKGKKMNQNEAWDFIYSPDDSFSEIANDIILDVLFANVNPGEPIKTPINFSRHKIMHGEHLNYGTKPNTIRTFLILDFLHELL